MAEISSQILSRLNTLSPELRSAILAKGVPLRTLGDLIDVLDQLIREQESCVTGEWQRPFARHFSEAVS